MSPVFLDKLEYPFLFSEGTKAQKPLIYRGLMAFVPHVGTENMGTVKSGDKLSPASVSMGTKARKPLIYRGLTAFAPTSVLRIWGL